MLSTRTGRLHERALRLKVSQEVLPQNVQEPFATVKMVPPYRVDNVAYSNEQRRHGNPGGCVTGETALSTPIKAVRAIRLVHVNHSEGLNGT